MVGLDEDDRVLFCGEGMEDALWRVGAVLGWGYYWILLGCILFGF